MMGGAKMTDRGSEPAFPTLVFHDEFDDSRGIHVPVPHLEGGLSKREYFASHHLAGLLAYPGPLVGGAEGIARIAVQYADVLLAELAKTTPDPTPIQVSPNPATPSADICSFHVGFIENCPDCQREKKAAGLC